ncbi:MAG: serine/threonine protein kinase [Planctomycetes bacterium]|nr:serine/threonine protein kinase [Planctomycetota bacterium]
MADEAKNKCPQCGADLPAGAPQGICPRCLLKQGLQPDTQAQTSLTPPGGFVPPEPDQIAGDFPQLEIIELLGRGGMGVVYKARQKQLDRIVALKILPPGIGQDPAFAERFTREAKALAKLNHPQIVTIHDIGKTQSGLYYFVMEYVDGTDLRQVLQTGNLSPQEALAIVPQICQALQYAHDEGIVHRDIKPENILLDKKGRVKIADFGLARLLDKPAALYTLTAVGQKMGTPHYMAPEQIAGSHNVDHRADIYSLGVVFYEMLTGQLPLGRFDPPSKKVQVDVRLDEIVLRTLEQEPARRYQHVSQVQTDIETIETPFIRAETPSDIFISKWMWPWHIRYVMAIAFIIVLIYTYKLVIPNASPALWIGLFLVGVVWFAFDAIRHRQTIRSASPCVMLLQSVVAVLVYLMVKPEPLLDWLYRVTAYEPGNDDVTFVRLLFAPVIVWCLYVIVRLYLKIQRFSRKNHPDATSLTKADRQKELTPEQALREQVKKPAIGLMIAACFACLFAFMYYLGVLTTFEEEGRAAALEVLEEMGWILNVGMALSVLFAVFIIVATTKMMNLQSYRLAVAACILGLIPTGFDWVVTGPFGLWALIVLAKQPVKDAFQKQNRTADIPTQTTAND